MLSCAGGGAVKWNSGGVERGHGSGGGQMERRRWRPQCGLVFRLGRLGGRVACSLQLVDWTLDGPSNLRKSVDNEG